MMIIDYIRQVDWSESDNKKIAQELTADAIEYAKRVEADIYEGNEIRSDSFMDVSDKQDAIRQLDRDRTVAHDRMLDSMEPFIDILEKETKFNKNDYALDNRTQKADFMASIIFELMDLEPVSRVEGSVRDELVEMLHKGIINYEQLDEIIRSLASE